MDMRYNLAEAQEIRNSLYDDISKKIYDARVQFAIYRDDISFSRDIASIQPYPVKSIHLLGEYMKDNPDVSGIAIYGAGHNGEYTYQLLKNTTFEKKMKLYFYDSDIRKKDRFSDGIEYISFSDMMRMKDEIIVIITPALGQYGIYNQLICSGFPYKHVLIPVENVMQSYFGHQYFDFFKPQKEEIFIDGGSFDGMTAKGFFNWCGKDNFGAVYAFEANPEQFDIIRRNTAELDHFELIPAGLWSEKTELLFYSRIGAGSFVGVDGDIRVEVDSIDRVLDGKKATFIKMDIEGSEYEALVGAKETIQKWNPRMAICIYHKPEDVFEIPALIKSYNREYKFAIRHYSSWINETILYAWIDE